MHAQLDLHRDQPSHGDCLGRAASEAEVSALAAAQRTLARTALLARCYARGRE